MDIEKLIIAIEMAERAITQAISDEDGLDGFVGENVLKVLSSQLVEIRAAGPRALPQTKEENRMSEELAKTAGHLADITKRLIDALAIIGPEREYISVAIEKVRTAIESKPTIETCQWKYLDSTWITTCGKHVWHSPDGASFCEFCGNPIAEVPTIIPDGPVADLLDAIFEPDSEETNETEENPSDD